MKKFIECIEGFVEHNRGLIFLILLLIAITGSIVGYRYYYYMNDSPEFCLTCHVMQSSFLGWQQSRHWNIKCQVCHKMSIFEQNRLLVAYIAHGEIAGPEKQEHGKTAPWEACQQCHSEDVKQGASLINPYGHEKHVLMEKIGCEKCHVSGRHNFPADGSACLGCHAGSLAPARKRSKASSCLDCHSFS